MKKRWPTKNLGDLFDLLAYVAYVAYALPPVTRTERADHARVHIQSSFYAKQRHFSNLSCPTTSASA
jgi:hypothetical protein